MLDRAVLVYVLNSRIGNAAVVFEERRKVPARNVAALINRGRQHRPAEFSEPNRIIGAATEERDAERSARCNHELCFLLFIGISKQLYSHNPSHLSDCTECRKRVNSDSLSMEYLADSVQKRRRNNVRLIPRARKSFGRQQSNRFASRVSACLYIDFRI